MAAAAVLAACQTSEVDVTEAQSTAVASPPAALATLDAGALENPSVAELKANADLRSPSQRASQVLRDQLIRDAARVRLRFYLDAIPTGEEADYGFTSRAEFGAAELGAAYELFVLSDSGETTPHDIWMVPVNVGDEMRAFISVRATEDAAYAAFSFGSALLARELVGQEKAYVGTVGVKIHTRSILRSYTHKADFASYNADLNTVVDPRLLQVHALETARMAFADKLEARPVSGALPRALNLNALKQVLRGP
jgi:hypothetical protein